jgi:hypothetical protein
MPNTSNPNLDRVRMQAVLLVIRGRTTPEVARHFGYSHSSVVRLVQRAKAEIWMAATESQLAHRAPVQSSQSHPTKETGRHVHGRTQQNGWLLLRLRLCEEGIRLPVVLCSPIHPGSAFGPQCEKSHARFESQAAAGRAVGGDRHP